MWQTTLSIFLVIVSFFFVTAYAQDSLTLSLDEAILLAVRTNPNVITSRLNYIMQKFNLYVQRWEFLPHYSLQVLGTSNQTSHEHKSSSGSVISPTIGATLLTPIGTQLLLTNTNKITSHYNPGLSFQVIQPLIRGFGRPVVENALYNALDSEYIARLNIEGTLRITVTNLINAYLNVVSAERTIIIDKDALQRATKAVTQTKLYIQAGRKAGNELVTVEANVASARTQLENDKNNLNQARFALLAAIGLDPNTAIRFTSLDLENLIQKYHVPTLDDTQRLVLDNDIQYQVDKITLYGQTTRALLVATDNTRWILNLTGNASTGETSGGGRFAGINSLFNGINKANSVTLNLTIPIDDELAKQSLLNAKISLREAELALLQEKWSKQTSSIDGWNTVRSAQKALQFAEDAERLQLRTYQISNQKYLHGLIDSLELQSAQLSLIQSQQASLSAKITYLKSLVSLDLLIGHTLRTWNIHVRI